MKIYPDTTRFRWPYDAGASDFLLNQISSGVKTATCCPKNMYSEGDLNALYGMVGKPVTVVDQSQAPRVNIFMLDVYETTFGNPDPRLLRGEGDSDNVRQFQQEHQRYWGEYPAQLSEETVLVVEEFEFVETIDPTRFGRA